MLRVPSSRKRSRPHDRLSVIPVMHTIVVFIFFLTLSACYLKYKELVQLAPLFVEPMKTTEVHNSLGLVLVTEKNEIKVLSGPSKRVIKSIRRLRSGAFDFEQLHQSIISLKKIYPLENAMILRPSDELTYEEIVKLMDAVKVLHKTDEAIYQTNQYGVEEKVSDLFGHITFENLI